MLMAVLAQAAALFLLWLFLQAAWHKLKPSNSLYYRDLMSEYSGLTADSAWLKLLLPLIAVFELLLALALVYGPSQSVASILAAAVLSFYLGLMAWQWYQGKRDMDCGCAGPGARLSIGPALLIRNLVLIALALLVLAHQGLDLSSWLLALCLSAVFALAYVCWEGLMANAQKITALRSL